ncbi:MAG: hypothetical protein QOG15_3756, partial [Solirubrobacteraceae bacterium]|nr:hypothetical protein [Solirubrobacteraceae bacterium]
MTTIDEAAATQRPATEIPTLKRRPCEACAVDVLIAAGTQIVLDARELTPLEPCPRCQLESRTRPAAPGPAPRRDVALRADLSPHHGSVALQHRACCAAKGRDPVACVCDPRAYLVVDHKHIRAG